MRLEKRVGIVADRNLLRHHIPLDVRESPKRMWPLYQRIDEIVAAGEVKRIDAREATEAEISAVHSELYLSQLREHSVSGNPFGYDKDTYLMEDTVYVASLAAGGCLALGDAVMDAELDTGLALIRPPGHHAHNSGGEEGFCFYNNVAIAARYAQQECHCDKILIIDWDYHHGNGTEYSFYEDPSVLFFSTHHWFAYPGTGDPSKHGSGDGYGYTINVPLQPGATDDDIKRAWEENLIPTVETFKPDFVFISAGFDSRKDDLLGCFSISDNCFADLTKMARTIADEYCDSRLVSTLEGGYNVHGCAKAVCAHVGALAE